MFKVKLVTKIIIKIINFKSLIKRKFYYFEALVKKVLD